LRGKELGIGKEWEEGKIKAKGGSAPSAERKALRAGIFMSHLKVRPTRPRYAMQA